ncbi:SIR2 family protein [Enterobacter kobei]|uniref:P-loop NTPase n=1 Tax=Enterobacter kobei TaxID=208224 RepID=UPI002002F7CC|nr:SIR2 family protein [Enterobacter kobei]MCK7109885.1 SIR2 family protein [Enterobacter kobei]
MNNDIKNAILEGRVMLLLGAGASFGSLTSSREAIPLGFDLAKILCKEADFDYNNESLPMVYSACSSKLGARLESIFDKYFRNCIPSDEYNVLARYTFARIYTLNIDDAFEKSLLSNSPQHIYIRDRNDKVYPQDQLFKNLDYVKLNGDSHHFRQGYIFSPQEYGAASAQVPLWYNELGSDFFNYKFIFIGSKLEEPLFYHQIERYRGKTHSTEQRSYVLTPTASEIAKASLMNSNIEHINATIGDFVEWLKREIPKPNTPSDTLIKSRPEYNVAGEQDQKSYMDAFKNVIAITRSNILMINERDSGSPIRTFYKGFKPTWKDILDGVPAFLDNAKNILKDIELQINGDNSKNLYCIFGSAGSGKSTLLKQIALKLSEKNYPVYFVDNINANLKELVSVMETKASGRYYICLERVADSAQILGEIFNQRKSMKCVFVGFESKHIWSYRGKEYFEPTRYVTKDVSSITRSDATKILEKVRLYGNWTYLEKLAPSERIKRLITNSRKQLLIGLMETTFGEGFEKIIHRDFHNIPSESHRALLILSGIATYQRVSAHESTLTRALINLGLDADIKLLTSQMDGILAFKNGYVETRHYAYIEKIFDNLVETQYLFNVLSAYIESFTVYDYPIVRNVSKTEGMIYKSLVNSKNLRKLLKGDKSKILDLYNKFEKKLEHEGLYLMQYGLALRYFNMQDESYDKLRVASQAFPNSPQIEHALAQQKIIMSLRCESESDAMKLFVEAEEILSRLDGGKVKLVDGYPIVTLSEGHVELARKFNGEEVAQKLAAQYHEKIRKLYQFSGSAETRIEETSRKLFIYSTTGKYYKNNTPDGVVIIFSDDEDDN